MMTGLTLLNTRLLLTRHSRPLPFLLMLFTAALTLITGGCAVDPEKSNVENAIIKHFASRNYEVVKIEIGKIEPLPLGMREYMAPKKHTVHITLIVLKSAGDSEENRQKRLTFRNALITISSTGKHGLWAIDNISGIPVL